MYVFLANTMSVLYPNKTIEAFACEALGEAIWHILRKDQ